MVSFTLLALLGSASTVLGHATWQDLWVNGVDQTGTCVRAPPSNNPVTDVTSNDLRCNVNGAQGVAGVCTVAAGQTLTVEMHQQPGDRTCTTDAIGGDHYGPIILYMSKVADATTADGSTPFFNVAEDGYDAAVGTSSWGTQILNANCGKRTFTVPSDLAPGDYLLRAEAIALHVASSVGGAQFYMGCYQVRVTGSGTKSPAGVLFPGAYKATDPGILINIYYPAVTNYTIPGPVAVFTG